MRGALKGSSFEKWEPENLTCVMEIDSFDVSVFGVVPFDATLPLYRLL